MASMSSLGAASGTRADEDLARAIALSKGSSACAWTWMAPGYSSTMTLPATERNHRRFPALTVEHGSALSLIARGTAVLNEEFANVDIGSDFKKWSKIGRILERSENQCKNKFNALVSNARPLSVVCVACADDK